MRRSVSRCALLLLSSLAPVFAQTPAATMAILEGDVVNSATSAPIAGARVKLGTGQAEPVYLRSDAKGHFLFNNLLPAIYLVSVDAPGFLKPAYPTPVQFMLPHKSASGSAECCMPGKIVSGSADADGTLHATVSIPLVAYAAITGRVTDPNGVPIENCPVEAFMKRPVETSHTSGYPRGGIRKLPDGKTEIASAGSVQTNDKGEFRVGRLEPGAWYVVAKKLNYGGGWESSFRTTYYPGTLDLASAKPLGLAAGQEARAEIRIVRQSGIRVAGHLIKPAGEESAAGSLLYTNITLVPEQNVLTNSNGPFTTGKDDYQLEDVLPGKYTLLALTRDTSTDPYGGNHKPVYGLMQPFEAGDQDMNGVDLVLRPLRDLSGAVTFSDGCTPFPVRVVARAVSPARGASLEAVSGADGSFLLHRPSPGRYAVEVSDPSMPGQPPVRAASMRMGDRDVRQAGFEAPIESGQALRIEIDCNAGGQR